MSYEILSNNIDIDTVSGDVDIKTPQNSSFSINFDSVSGDLDNSFTGISKNSMFVINEGLHQILVNTVSGDLRIFN